MPAIELEEVQMIETSDDALEIVAVGIAGAVYSLYSACPTLVNKCN